MKRKLQTTSKSPNEKARWTLHPDPFASHLPPTPWALAKLTAGTLTHRLFLCSLLIWASSVLLSRGFLPDELLGFLCSRHPAAPWLAAWRRGGKDTRPPCLQSPRFPPALGCHSQNSLVAPFHQQDVGHSIIHPLTGRMHYCCLRSGLLQLSIAQLPLFRVAPVPDGMCNETGGCCTSTSPAARIWRWVWGRSRCKEQSIHGEQSAAGG